MANPEYMCGSRGGAGTSQLHDLSYTVSGTKWHPPALMQGQIVVPGPGGLTGMSP